MMNEIAIRVASLKADIRDGMPGDMIEYYLDLLAKEYGAEVIGEEWLHPTPIAL